MLFPAARKTYGHARNRTHQARAAMSFRCGPDGNSSNLWCYNEGVCAPAPGLATSDFTQSGLYCMCPSNVRFDLYLFHDFNCTNPSDVTYLAIFVASLLVALVVFVRVAIVVPRSRNAKHLQRLSMAGLIAMNAMNLAIFLQGGAYEGAAVLWPIALSCDVVALFKLTSAVLRPPIALEWRNASRAIRLYGVANVLVFAACGAWMIATCRSDQTSYNGAIVVVFLALLVMNTVNPVINLHHAQAIYVQIDLAKYEAQAQKLANRIMHLKRGLIPGIIVGFLLNVPLPVQHYFQGSVPYAWLILSVMMNGINLFIHVLIALFLKWDANQGRVIVSALSTAEAAEAAKALAV